MKSQIQFKLLALLLLFATTFLPHSGAAQCSYIPVSGGNTPDVTFTHSGGFFASFGCAPIDPTYWVAGASGTVTFTFTVPRDNPIFRVWGMNTDDFATVQVNGAAYPLNAVSAYELPKVVCGISPGPLGVVFNGGNLQGGNTPAQGNYSYSDVVIATTNVSSITVSSVSGAGWGIAGTSIECVLPSGEVSPPTRDPSVSDPTPSISREIRFFSSPGGDLLHFEGIEGQNFHTVGLRELSGKELLRIHPHAREGSVRLDSYSSGIYLLWLIDQNGETFLKKIFRP